MTEKIIKKPTIKKTITIKKPVGKNVVKEDSKNNYHKAFLKKEENDIEIKKISSKQVKIVKTKTQEKTRLDNLNRAYATGKRKNAIAKVWLKKGSGKIIINDKEASEYLQRPILEVIVNLPFTVTETQDKYDIYCKVIGGGLSGQAGAVKHGIAKALNIFNEEAYRKSLKNAGLLTRDSRVVERKKPGLKKARKGQVFSKR